MSAQGGESVSFHGRSASRFELHGLRGWDITVWLMSHGWLIVEQRVSWGVLWLKLDGSLKDLGRGEGIAGRVSWLLSRRFVGLGVIL